MSKSPAAPSPSFEERALAFGRDVYTGHGKIEILPKVAAHSLADMAVAYTPGVGSVVRHLLKHPEELGRYTTKDNMIALVTDGTAVLGFGNVGPRAGMAVMEGKAVMFKALAGIDCMPLCLDVEGAEAFCDVVAALEPTFGGINMEDVAAPHCFKVLESLESRLNIPVIHDDQFGTATVAIAALINALAVTGRKAEGVRVVVNGIGAAGTATLEMLEALGTGDITPVDKPGILVKGQAYSGRADWEAIAVHTNRSQISGGLAEALKGADAFIGLSVGGLVSPEMIRSMAPGPIVFALANPEPEIAPEAAIVAGAAVAASGRFDAPNHCNNVLAFPGLMRGALDCRARRVSMSMRLAAARALAAKGSTVADCLLPSPLDVSVHAEVAAATAEAAVEEGLAQVMVTSEFVRRRTLELTRLVHERQMNLPGSRV